MRQPMIKSKIFEYLSDNGEKNTHEVLKYINKNTRQGVTIQCLNNLLARDKRYDKREGKTRPTMRHPKPRVVCYWSVKKE